jgi:hypothetical protein
VFIGALRGVIYVALLWAGATMTGATPGAATTPDRSWVGVENIVILSRFTSGNVLTSQFTAEKLCQQARAIAGRGSPIPVTCGNLGDPKLAQAKTAVLILDASIAETGPAAVLVVTVRRESEGGLEPAPIRFGATPRVVSIDRRSGTGQMESALRASLGEILPWLRNDELKELKPIRARRR